mgnify:CR=1 FL=1
MLQLSLVNIVQSQQKVFIDADHLKSLDQLFEIVGKQTDAVLAICSAEFLPRPWCMGELVTAIVSDGPSDIAEYRKKLRSPNMQPASGELSSSLSKDASPNCPCRNA